MTIATSASVARPMRTMVRQTYIFVHHMLWAFTMARAMIRRARQWRTPLPKPPPRARTTMHARGRGQTVQPCHGRVGRFMIAAVAKKEGEREKEKVRQKWREGREGVT